MPDSNALEYASSLDSSYIESMKWVVPKKETRGQFFLIDNNPLFSAPALTTCKFLYQFRSMIPDAVKHTGPVPGSL
jgi:hypothetical protein